MSLYRHHQRRTFCAASSFLRGTTSSSIGTPANPLDHVCKRPRPALRHSMSDTPAKLSLSSSGQQGIYNLAIWLAECEGNIGYEAMYDKAGNTVMSQSFAMCIAAGLKESIEPVGTILREALQVESLRTYTVLRTRSEAGGMTGRRKNQHMISVRVVGQSAPSIEVAGVEAPFPPYTVVFSPEPAVIKGDVEFLVLSEKSEKR